jgi:hypothetical protein
MSNQNVLVVDEGAQDAGFRRVRGTLAQDHHCFLGASGTQLSRKLCPSSRRCECA